MLPEVKSLGYLSLLVSRDMRVYKLRMTTLRNYYNLQQHQTLLPEAFSFQSVLQFKLQSICLDNALLVEPSRLRLSPCSNRLGRV